MRRGCTFHRFGHDGHGDLSAGSSSVGVRAERLERAGADLEANLSQAPRSEDWTAGSVARPVQVPRAAPFSPVALTAPEEEMDGLSVLEGASESALAVREGHVLGADVVVCLGWRAGVLAGTETKEVGEDHGAPNDMVPLGGFFDGVPVEGTKDGWVDRV